MSDGIDHDFLHRLYGKMGDGTIQNAKQAEERGYTVDRHCYPWIAYKGARFDPDELFYILTDNEDHLVNMLNDASFRMDDASKIIQENLSLISVQKRLLRLCRINSKNQRAHMKKQKEEINSLKSKVTRLQSLLKGRS